MAMAVAMAVATVAVMAVERAVVQVAATPAQTTPTAMAVLTGWRATTPAKPFATMASAASTMAVSEMMIAVMAARPQASLIPKTPAA